MHTSSAAETPLLPPAYRQGYSTDLPSGQYQVLPLPIRNSHAQVNEPSTSQETYSTLPTPVWKEPPILLEGIPYCLYFQDEASCSLRGHPILEGVPMCRFFEQASGPSAMSETDAAPLDVSHTIYAPPLTDNEGADERGTFGHDHFGVQQAEVAAYEIDRHMTAPPARYDSTPVDLSRYMESLQQAEYEQPDQASLLGQQPVPVFEEDAKWEKKQIELRLERMWASKGLDVSMSPAELAAGVTEIKLQLGFSSQVGQMASRRVKEEASTKQGYYPLFQTWIRRYTKKISYLRKEIAKDKRYQTDEQRNVALFQRFRQVCPKEYDAVYKDRTPKVRKKEKNVDAKAQLAWDLLVESRLRPALGEDAKLLDASLPVDTLEEHSRGLKLEPYRKGTTTEYIKKYMQKFLHYTAQDMDRFSTLRTTYRQRRDAAALRKKQREKKRKRRDKGKEVVVQQES